MPPVSPPLRVFVSHSSKDHAFATKLVRYLRAALGHEHTVWYDEHSLTGGDEWWPMIVKELDRCTVFVVILSPDAMKSRWVLDEINIAWKRKNSPANIRFIPLLHLPCNVRRDLETLQIISFLDPKPYDDAFNELLKAIQPFGEMIRTRSVAKNRRSSQKRSLTVSGQTLVPPRVTRIINGVTPGIALAIIVGSAVVLWFANSLNSLVLGSLIGGLAGLLLSIPISLTMLSYLSRRHAQGSSKMIFFTTSSVVIVGAAVVAWFGNSLNSLVLGGLMGGLAGLLLSIPISLIVFIMLARYSNASQEHM
jgi:hypothetical protein